MVWVKAFVSGLLTCQLDAMPAGGEGRLRVGWDTLHCDGPPFGGILHFQLVLVVLVVVVLVVLVGVAIIGVKLMVWAFHLTTIVEKLVLFQVIDRLKPKMSDH